MLFNLSSSFLVGRHVNFRSWHEGGLLLWLILIPAFFFRFSSTVSADQCLPTAGYVDLLQYSGTWYEVARLPNAFQRNCRCSVAEYRPSADGSVTVINTCTTPKGRQRQVVGRATAVPGSGNARLRVGFGRVSNFFAQKSSGNYWIIDVAPDYSWAMVGTPDRKYLWLLSRSPQLSTEILTQLTQRARELGFDTNRLIY